MTDIARWMADPCAFIEEVLHDPLTGRPFQLNPAQRRFLRVAFRLTPDGRMRYTDLCFGAPKKSGKTALASFVLLYAILVLGGRYAEGFAIANDHEQARSRVFQAMKRIVEASPLLAADAEMHRDRITFRASRATITALATDYAGGAGANPTATSIDEPWAITTEAGVRMVDEMVAPPTVRIGFRFFTSYAGFSGESTLLEDLYKRGLAGKQIGPDLYEAGGLLMFWTHDFTAPWQTEKWREQMRSSLRPNAYLRLIENRWVSGESSFIDPAWWDACVDPEVHPVVSNPGLPVWIGLDASTKRDSTAIVVASWDTAAKKCRLVWHRIFQPTPDDPLNFEATVEATLLSLAKRFDIRAVRFDPFQLVATAQRLMAAGLPMREFPQSVPNLTEASTNLYELVKGGNVISYPDDDIKLAMQRAVALETSRGWRIAKEKASHRIDVVVALGMAALGAVQGQEEPQTGWPVAYVADGPTGIGERGVSAHEHRMMTGRTDPYGTHGGDRYVGSMEWARAIHHAREKDKQ